MKIKEVKRDTKEHLKEAVKDKTVQAGIRTKDKAVKTAADRVQQTVSNKGKNSQQSSDAPENYASDEVTEAAKNTVEEAGLITEKAAVKGYSKARDKIRKKRSGKKETEASEHVDEPIDDSSVIPNEHSTEVNSERRVPEQTGKDIKEKSPSAVIKSEEKTVPKKAEDKEQNKQSLSVKRKDKTLSNSQTEETGKGTKAPDKKAESTVSPVRKQSEPDLKVTVQGEEKSAERTVRTRTKTAPRSREYSSPINRTSREKAVKHCTVETEKKIRTTSRSAETGKRTVKTADTAVKTAEKSMEAAKKTAETAAKTTKRTAKASEKASKAAIEGAQALVKALAELGKAAAAGIKSLGALIAGGGGVTVLIIIICVLIAAIAGTFIGVFLTNDVSTGSEMTMNAAVSQLTSEYFASLTDFEAGYTYDTIEVKGDMSINWKEVIAVYAVQSTNGTEGTFEVATLNADKVNVMKTILLDMRSFTGDVVSVPEVTATISTDKNGHSVVTYTTVNKQKLTVNVARKTPMQYAEEKGFSEEAKAQLDELLSGEYDELWDELLAGVVTVLQTNSVWKPTSIFCWPLENDSYISSHFGTRVDPISGVIKTHLGTDIPAVFGTPILAAADGIATVPAYMAGGYGNYVILQHDGGFQTVYGHCSSVLVSSGQHVVQGQVIAFVGSTGYSTGNHLHYEVRVNGIKVDALNYYTAD